MVNEFWNEELCEDMLLKDTLEGLPDSYQVTVKEDCCHQSLEDIAQNSWRIMAQHFQP